MLTGFTLTTEPLRDGSDLSGSTRRPSCPNPAGGENRERKKTLLPPVNLIFSAYVFIFCVIYVRMLLGELPLDGDIWRRRGSMKGVNEEEDLCLDMELLSDWD